MAGLVLYGEPGWGSAIAEAQLVWYGLEFAFVRTGDLFAEPGARAKLQDVNPLGQIPTLVLEDDSIMTESAAITLYLADLTGRDDLVPPPSHPARGAFLRWLVFIVANIYPTYTYADDPSRFVSVEAARAPFKSAVHDYAKRLYAQLDEAAGSPWFLGNRLSALDFYLVVLTHWEPGRD
ncbi:MAG TPA: glutathione S-transferase N-terminal domain-containing protein, partial [Acidocella sp.]|nr:glutathione S-transferase N-terminal domain-containing protein [Acidocella sp.]